MSLKKKNPTADQLLHAGLDGATFQVFLMHEKEWEDIDIADALKMRSDESILIRIVPKPELVYFIPRSDIYQLLGVPVTYNKNGDVNIGIITHITSDHITVGLEKVSLGISKTLKIQDLTIAVHLVTENQEFNLKRIYPAYPKLARYKPANEEKEEEWDEDDDTEDGEDNE